MNDRGIFLRVFAASLVCVLAACARGASSPLPAVSAETSVHSAQELNRGLYLELRTQLSLLATGKSPDPRGDAAWLAQVAADPKRAVGDTIAALVSDPDFARRIGPRLVASGAIHAPGVEPTSRRWVLRRGANDVFFLRRACAAADVVTVVPWWDPTRTVKICTDSYRPARFEAGNHAGYCSGLLQAPGEHQDEATACGCGPNLMRCFPSEERLVQFTKNLVAEVVETASHVIEEDSSLDRAFTSTSTFRNADAELLYRRWRVEAQHLGAIPGLDELATWPAAGKWAPRDEIMPGEHAGILTALMTIYRATGLRAVAAWMHEWMWCDRKASANVETKPILDIAHAALKNGGDIRSGVGAASLMHLPGCTSCHARLDSTTPFFKGFMDIRVGQHYEPTEVLRDRGPLYHDDIKDPRGTAELTPASFAKLAVALPEYSACMAQKVGSHIFANRATAADLDAIRSAFDEGHVMRRAFRVGLERYAARFVGASAEPEPAVTFPAALSNDVERRCLGCHGAWSSLHAANAWPIPLASEMLRRVAAGEMPKGKPLEPAVRDDLVLRIERAILGGAGGGDAGDAAARERALPIHLLPQVLEGIQDRAGARAEMGLSLVDVHSEVAQYTPGVAAMVMLQAAKTCRSSGRAGAAFEACLANATDPSSIINGVGRR